MWISWEDRATFEHFQLHLTYTQTLLVCLQDSVTTFPYIHVNHRAGSQRGKQLLVIRSNWKIQTAGMPSRFFLKHLFNVWSWSSEVMLGTCQCVAAWNLAYQFHSEILKQLK